MPSTIETFTPIGTSASPPTRGSTEALALRYAARGWNVFPVHAGDKTPATEHGHNDATTDPAIIRSWWKDMPDASVGIRCGTVSGIVVLDVDVGPGKHGDVSLRALEAKHGTLPTTLEAATGGGGRHLYFRMPGRPVRSSIGTLGVNLDVKADGGYVVAPPSIHPSGKRYAWLGDVPLADAPEWILEPPSKNGHEPADAIPETISDGQRNATLASLAGTMRRRGASQDAIEAALVVMNDDCCDPPLPDDEVHGIAVSVGRYAPAGGTKHGGMADTPPFMADGDSRIRPYSDPVDAQHGGMADTTAPTGMGAGEDPIADTLDAVRAVLASFVVLTPAQLDAVALWTAHTHAFDAAEATPYLAISSPEKRSGKTRLLEVLDGLVARPWLTGRTSAAALYRKIDKQEPTLLLDESDAAFNGAKEYAEALRGILNTGHRRGGCASHCVGSDVGDFSTFSPKAIAGIGRLPDTVVDRAIPIVMRRRAPDEAVEPFRNRTAVTATQPLHAALAAWAVDAVAPLTDAEPSIPDALDDRAADGWEPLLAIADLAGGEWPLRARAAALALSTGIARDDDSIGVRLLSDVRSIFLASATDRLPSGDLAGALAEIEDAPWGAWGKHEKPLDARALARLLGRYGIRPGSIRLPTGGTLKGYYAESFDDAWLRYLPATGPTNGTPAQAARTAVEGAAAGHVATATRTAQERHVPDADHRGGADSHPEAPECAGVPFVALRAGMDAGDVERSPASPAFE